MTRIADQEQVKEWRVKRLTDRINDLTQEIENRNRVKCEHCGKFTKIFK